MICCKCGKIVPDGAIFCCWCGEKNTKKVCAACGTVLREDQLFCHECGVKWDGETPRTAEWPPEEVIQQGELPIVQSEVMSERQLPSGKTDQQNTDNKCAYTLTIFRKWQAGSNKSDFKVYVDGVELGNIGAGESLFTEISSDQVQIEIKCTSSIIMPIQLHMFLRAVEHNPKISFELRSYDATGYSYFPHIDATVSGAEILRSES